MTDPFRPPSTEPTGPARGVYLPRKIEAIESFLGFVRGEEFPRFPLEVFLEISNVCDLACVMCPTFSALNPDRKTAIQETPLELRDGNVSSSELRGPPLLKNLIMRACQFASRVSFY